MIGTLDAIVSTLIATSSTLTAIISTLIATIGTLDAFALSAFRRYFASMADAVLRRGHGIRDVRDALQPCIVRYATAVAIIVALLVCAGT